MTTSDRPAGGTADADEPFVFVDVDDDHDDAPFVFPDDDESPVPVPEAPAAEAPVPEASVPEAPVAEAPAAEAPAAAAEEAASARSALAAAIAALSAGGTAPDGTAPPLPTGTPPLPTGAPVPAAEAPPLPTGAPSLPTGAPVPAAEAPSLPVEEPDPGAASSEFTPESSALRADAPSLSETDAASESGPVPDDPAGAAQSHGAVPDAGAAGPAYPVLGEGRPFPGADLADSAPDGAGEEPSVRADDPDAPVLVDGWPPALDEDAAGSDADGADASADSDEPSFAGQYDVSAAFGGEDAVEAPHDDGPVLPEDSGAGEPPLPVADPDPGSFFGTPAPAPTAPAVQDGPPQDESELAAYAPPVQDDSALLSYAPPAAVPAVRADDPVEAARQAVAARDAATGVIAAAVRSQVRAVWPNATGATYYHHEDDPDQPEISVESADSDICACGRSCEQVPGLVHVDLTPELVGAIRDALRPPAILGMALMEIDFATLDVSWSVDGYAGDDDSEE